MIENEMKLTFRANSENEHLARMVIAAFVIRLDPTLEEIADLKTAVSEAVTNCIIHGYREGQGEILLRSWIEERMVHVEVIDFGVGITDIEKAMEPMYTSREDLHRSGMGFAFMEAFMDELEVTSEPEHGTRVYMNKKLGVN